MQADRDLHEQPHDFTYGEAEPGGAEIPDAQQRSSQAEVDKLFPLKGETPSSAAHTMTSRLTAHNHYRVTEWRK